MSYSTCFLCGTMTSMYDKYCSHCLEKHSLIQGDWRIFKPKTEYGTLEREQEEKDEIKKDFRWLFFRSGGEEILETKGRVVHLLNGSTILSRNSIDGLKTIEGSEIKAKKIPRKFGRKRKK